MEADGLTVDRVRCIRCGACSTVAPATFSLREGPVTLLGQPTTPRERELAQAALLICPSHAIGVHKERP
jgi:ferredoxin